MCCFAPIAIYLYIRHVADGQRQHETTQHYGIGTGMAINIILNLVLIPKFQVVGSAFSSLTTQLLTSGAQVIMVQLLFRFKINYKLLTSLGIFVILTILINYYISGQHGSWVSHIALGIAASICLAFIFKLISIRNLIYIVKYGE